MSGIDVPIPSLGITLTQPKVKDIAILGENDYFLALSLLNLDPKRFGSEEVSEWLIFTEALKQDVPGVNIRNLVSNFLQLFSKEKITIGPRSLLIMGEEMKNIEPDQFGDFKKLILQVGGGHLFQNTATEFKPANKKAAEIAEKMKRGRERIAAQKPKSTSTSFLGKYLKVLATMTSNSISQGNEMTIFQLEKIVKTYLSWEEYDLQVRIRLAGGDKNKDKLVHWMEAMDIEKQNSSVGIL